jgi:ABC-2 type transport system permease protein
MIVNLLTMPLMFMSGVFHQVNTMSDWMKTITMLNPLSYTVHAVRYWLTGASVGLDYMNPTTDITILTGAAIILLAIACWAFNKATIEE